MGKEVILFGVHEVSTGWKHSVDSWEQRFVAEEEVWDEILGDLSAL